MKTVSKAIRTAMSSFKREKEKLEKEKLLASERPRQDSDASSMEPAVSTATTSTTSSSTAPNSVATSSSANTTPAQSSTTPVTISRTMSTTEEVPVGHDQQSQQQQQQQQQQHATLTEKISPSDITSNHTQQSTALPLTSGTSEIPAKEKTTTLTNVRFFKNILF